MLYAHLTQLQEIQSQALNCYPEECCGLLLGRRLPTALAPNAIAQGPTEPLTERVVVLEAIYPAINTWGESIESIHPLAETEPTATASLATKHKRYWIEPATLLQAQKYARDRGWDIIGIYHSHPDHPALPSECDRQWAWSDYSYMIVSVTQAKADPIQSWVLDGQHQFQSEPILTQSSPAVC